MYMAKKDKMTDGSSRPPHQVEKDLFHGTVAKNLEQINTKGFNRSFKGVNGEWNILF